MAPVSKILEHKGSEVASITRDQTALDAARLMNDKRIGSLVVLEGDKVIGIVTERDILRRLVACECDPSQTPVSKIMSSPVACCRPRTSIEECRGVMTEKRIRHLPVVEKGRLQGIITSGDILAREIEESQNTIEYLHEYLYAPKTPHG